MKNKKTTSRTIARLTVISLAIASSFSIQSYAQQITQELNPVTIIGERLDPFGYSLSGDSLNRRFANSDTATLLDGIPGVSFYTGGGVSSLPVIDGLADDRIKVTVDGMSITAACPNHMNPAISYIDPSAVSRINVYAGIVPVSQGGDSIGGSIAIKSAPPVFAQPGEGLKTTSSVSTYHRSNGNVTGLNIKASESTENFSIGYSGNTVESSNYKDANGNPIIASAYKVRNNQLSLATKSDSDLWTIEFGWQDIPYQGFPNQAMDMTMNKSLSINAGYTGNYNWGNLEARAFRQHVRHHMDVFQDKASAKGWAYADSYMPMDTEAVDLGYSVVATVKPSDNEVVRYGHEFHRYTLNDWWPGTLPVMGMGPDDFVNINHGRRDRLALFAEQDKVLSDKLSTQLGARVEQVTMNTGNAQGYFNASSYPSYDPWMLMGGDPNSIYANDANSFNAKNHLHKDLNWDITASARYIESATETYDIGVSRKTRSPNMHELYTWSHENMMAGLMNNWFGDLNSYVGNLNLKPEVAYSLKATADWHAANKRDWSINVSPYYTYVKDYINATADTNAIFPGMSMTLGGGQALTFINQDAYLYGFDATSKKYLGRANGDWTARASLSYTRGRTVSGDNLYNIMPLNARVAIDHQYGKWNNSLEGVFVNAKTQVSAVRAEQTTPGYAIANYRTGYSINKSTRLEASVDNLLNHQYSLPLGGLEYTTGAPTRAMGRSVNVGLSIVLN